MSFPARVVLVVLVGAGRRRRRRAFLAAASLFEDKEDDQGERDQDDPSGDDLDAHGSHNSKNKRMDPGTRPAAVRAAVSLPPES